MWLRGVREGARDERRHAGDDRPRRRSLRGRLALIAVVACAVTAFAAPGAASAAESVEVQFPPQGGVFKSGPADYTGVAFPDIFPLPPIYLPQVTGAVQQYDPATGTWIGSKCLEQPVSLCGVLVWRTVLDTFGESWSWSGRAEGSGSNVLVDGQYRVRVGQAGGFGIPTNYAENYFYVDSNAPDTAVVSGPSPYIKDPSATLHFEFSGTDPKVNEYASGISYFNCQLDGGPWEHCIEPGSSAPYTYEMKAPEGGHTLKVAALDKAENEDQTPAEYSWIADATPPEITIAKPVDKDHYVLHQNVTPEFSCKDPLAGSPPAASGIASCTATPIDTSTLGPKLFTVKSTDKAGNESTKTIAYVVDPPRYGDFVLEDHPLAYYRLNEPLGSGPMLDSSGHGHDGEYKNGVVLRRPAAIACERRPHPPLACNLKNDPQDYSAYFPARDGYGYANGITAPTQAYSIEGWVKPTDGADMMIAAHGGGGQLFISGGHLAFRQTQDTIVAGGAGGAVPPGQWSYVAATWDGHTSRLFVDGHEVASSTSANKEPSGSATFYVGYGDQAPWFHGYEDEVAYYDSALSPGRIFDRWAIGTAYDHPSPTGPGTSQTGLESTNTALPYANIVVPVNNATYAPTKVPVSDFNCSDLDGPGDVASCVAELNGTPIKSGDPLPQTPGSYTLTLTATDIGGNVYVHTHKYVVEPYADVARSDGPIAYYRLGDPAGSSTMADSSGHGINGEYKNDTESGPVGISGDGDHARLFEGEGGYGYVNGITAPTNESSLEAWVDPADGRNEAIVGHGDAGELDIIGGHFSYRRMDTILTAQIGPAGHCVAPTPGSWTHVVGTWDGVTMRIYVNGELCDEVESTKRPSSSSTFYVGFGELAPWFYGAIDEVGYYPTALSGERVYEHYIADPPPAELGAVGGEAPAAGGETSSRGESPTSAGSSDTTSAAGSASGSSGTAAGTASATGQTGVKQPQCARKVGNARKACLKHQRRKQRRAR